MLRALADHVQYANIYTADGICIKQCSVHVHPAAQGVGICLLVDIQDQACKQAGVIDTKTELTSYQLIGQDQVLYSGTLEPTTKSANAGLLVKIILTFEG